MRCKVLNDIGIGLDFREIKRLIKEVIEALDHKNLNDHPAFINDNPTSENIAKYIYKELSKRIGTDVIAISKVKVSKTESAGAYYWEE